MFWPFAYGDLFSFAFWPYYDPFWDYGPDFIYASLYWPYGNDDYAYYGRYYSFGDIYSGSRARLSPRLKAQIVSLRAVAA